MYNCLIYDRTAEDISEAKKIRDGYIKKFVSLSSEQIQQLERGFLTVNTLNRIESKQSELKILFDENYYFADKPETKQWEIGNVFLQSDFDRILNNLKLLINAFFVYDSTPDVPKDSFTNYTVINDVEKILYDLECITAELEAYYRECGNYECGGNNLW